MRYLFLFFVCMFLVTSPVFALQLRSPAFGAKGEIPYVHTCQDSQDVSIPFTWSDVPLGTRSFTIIMEERVKLGTRVHWMIYNIPDSTRQLNPGIARIQKLPNEIMQGVNDFEVTGYSGPCPADTLAHQYFITIYALDTIISFGTSDVRKENLMSAMCGHIIEQFQLVGQHARVRQ